MTKSSYNTQNLTSWKPGQSGNPKGRPKGRYSLVSILNLYLQDKIDVTNPNTQKKHNIEVGTAVIMSLVKAALDGDVQAARTILDRIDGKVVQEHALSGQVDINQFLGKVIQKSQEVQDDPDDDNRHTGAEPVN